MEPAHEERPSVGDLVRNSTLSVSAYFALWAGAGGVLHYFGWPAFSVIALAGGAAGAIVGLVLLRRARYRLFFDRLELLGVEDPVVIPLDAVVALAPWRPGGRKLVRAHGVDREEWVPRGFLWPGKGWWVVVYRGRRLPQAAVIRPSARLLELLRERARPRADGPALQGFSSPKGMAAPGTARD